MKTYQGRRIDGQCMVSVRDGDEVRWLDPLQQEWSYLVPEFGWGHHGLETRVLALALVADATGSADHARCVYDRLVPLLSGIMADEFSLTEANVCAATRTQ